LPSSIARSGTSAWLKFSVRGATSREHHRRGAGATPLEAEVPRCDKGRRPLDQAVSPVRHAHGWGGEINEGSTTEGRLQIIIR